LEDLSVDGKNTKTDLREIEWICVDWIHVAQYRFQWRILTIKETNFQFQKWGCEEGGISLLAKQLLASQEGFRSYMLTSFYIQYCLFIGIFYEPQSISLTYLLSSFIHFLQFFTYLLTIIPRDFLLW